MIPRYSRPDMVAIWSPETKFKIWFEIEAHACDAQAAIGVIPKENAAAVFALLDDPSDFFADSSLVWSALEREEGQASISENRWQHVAAFRGIVAPPES